MKPKKNNEQQMGLNDALLHLTERERKMVEGSWAKVFADEVFPMIDEERFGVLYSEEASRPGNPINVTVGALVIKELFDYTDKQVVESLCCDVRMQYALHTTSFEEQPLSDKSLYRFRRRCYEYEAETGIDLWRDCVKDLARKTAKLMGIDGRIRRMDSMMVESNIRTLSRSEVIYECLANACRALRKLTGAKLPSPFDAYADRDGFNKVFYHDRQATHEEKLAKIMADAESLVEAHGDALRESEELGLLLRCLIEQTVVEDGTRRLRTKEDGMKGSRMLQSPYDADATFRKKAGKEHRGFVANLEESCGEAGTIVTNYDYQENVHSDSDFLKEFADEAEPVEGASLVTDGGYDGGGNVAYAAERGIELITTALIGKDPIDALADFSWSVDGKTLIQCAAGHAPTKCGFVKSTGQCRLTFDSSCCEGCPFRDQCKPKVKGGKATFTSSSNASRRARHKRRMGSEGFEAYSRLRNGAETVPSMLRRNYGLESLPRGKTRGKFFFGAKVAALNFRKLCGFRRGTGNYAKNPLLSREV